MMKAIFIERHNIAARMVLKLLKVHMAIAISWLTYMYIYAYICLYRLYNPPWGPGCP